MTSTCGQDDLILCNLFACNSILKSFWNNLGSELQLSKLKWCNIDEAKEANNDFFITAKICCNYGPNFRIEQVYGFEYNVKFWRQNALSITSFASRLAILHILRSFLSHLLPRLEGPDQDKQFRDRFTFKFRKRICNFGPFCQLMEKFFVFAIILQLMVFGFFIGINK